MEVENKNAFLSSL